MRAGEKYKRGTGLPGATTPAQPDPPQGFVHRKSGMAAGRAGALGPAADMTLIHAIYPANHRAHDLLSKLSHTLGVACGSGIRCVGQLGGMVKTQTGAVTRSELTYLWSASSPGNGDRG